MLSWGFRSCPVEIASVVEDSALNEIVVDAAFDLLVNVASPNIILYMASTRFELDRQLFRVYISVFTPGSFKRQSRTQVDPSQITLAWSCVELLRIQTATDLMIRVGMNIAFAY